MNDFKPKIAQPNNGRLSVVIAAFNAERYIERAIRSVRAQTYKYIELIVVDDGSTDNTVDFVRSLNCNATILRNETNLGPAASRTVGLHNASGEYIAFLDADDYWLEDMASTAVGFLQRNPDAIAVYTGYRSIEWNGRSTDWPVLSGKTLETYGRPEGIVLPDFYTFWRNHANILTGTVTMRTTIARETGGQRAELRLTEDLEFWAYLGTFGPWGFIHRPLFVTDQCAQTASERLHKFKKRFRYFSTIEVENWSARIRSRITATGEAGFDLLEAHIATTILIANAYCLNITKAWQLAERWHTKLDGKIGAFLRLGYRCGRVTWPLFCAAVPVREQLKARLGVLKRFFDNK